MGLFDRFRRTPRGTVKVPEGHQVVTVSPAPEPCVARMESGAVIADFGPQPASAAVFDAVERRLREEPQVMVVWVSTAPPASTPSSSTAARSPPCWSAPDAAARDHHPSPRDPVHPNAALVERFRRAFGAPWDAEAGAGCIHPRAPVVVSRPDALLPDLARAAGHPPQRPEPRA